MRFPTPPRNAYPSDLTDKQWSLLEPLVPPEVKGMGRPREVDFREVINAILYLNRSGCQWDMLPHDLPPKSTVYDYFAKWRDDGTWQRMMDALRMQVRVAAGREADPQRGERRQPERKDDGYRRRAGLRRREEGYGPKTPCFRGYIGVAAGRDGDRRQRGRRGGRATVVQASCPRNGTAADQSVGRFEVSQL